MQPKLLKRLPDHPFYPYPSYYPDYPYYPYPVYQNL